VIPQAVRYYSVSAAALATDVALFQTGVLLGLPAGAAAACSYLVAALLHFFSNRLWSFRAFDRPAHAQLRTYAAVQCVSWAITVAVVTVFTGMLHLAPLAAKGVAVVTVLPIGFFAHKFLTFGRGIRPLLSLLRLKWRTAWK
jgi:putative flippase GtrA